ncbi:MAG: YggS family pyridoxal phosphate-dependent enzyme [Roseiflexaceae bacterium]|jgi:PLP dependent protein
MVQFEKTEAHTMMQQALTLVQQRITHAAMAAGRPPQQIRLIGVSKTHPASVVAAAHAAGLHDFGENRVQEAEGKITELAALRHQMTWHLIGHLQRNKAKRAVQLFDYIHSVDSIELAQSISRHTIELGKTQSNILLQCNISGEVSKEGIDARGWETARDIRMALVQLVQQIAQLPGITICGLMTIAPYSDDPEHVRPVFASLRMLRDMLREVCPQHPFTELSMGMSGDVDVAIAEGATMVRVGRALFGERPTPGSPS